VHNKALFAVLAGAVLGGIVSVFVKIAISSFPPLSLTFLRFFIAFLVFLPFVIGKKFDTKNLRKLIFITLLNTANLILFVFGIKHTIPTLAQTMYSAVPIIVSLLSFHLLGEKFSAKKVTGIVVGLVGVLMIVLLPALKELNLKGVTLYGNVLIFIGVFLYSCYTVLSKPLMKSYSPVQITFSFVVITGLISVLGVPSETVAYGEWWKVVPMSHGLILLYLGTIGTSVLYFLYQYAIKHGSPLISSLTLYFTPVFTYFWAFIFLGEKLMPEIILGALLVFSGAWLVNSA